MKISTQKINKKLEEVLDPELNISIVDLGLVYDVIVDKSKVKVLMTLTTIGCPLISLIEDEVKSKLKELGLNEKDITVDLTFDPPWSMEKMSEKAKALLGIS
ncbi:metal-sulfur cluster assembly factor [Candidatus Roizmanbacteria bacterium]|nr:metal-sulfur cluster assembly factor [Candidatus Roizmanbacteria bacterium]